jgi:ribosomal protein L3 glutamine methyltransferase
MNLAMMIDRVAGQLDAAGVFFGHGTDNAVDEACWLVTAALGRDPDIADQDLGLELAADQVASIKGLIERRIETRKPLAYLVGHAWLAGLKFEINEHVLVPRSPLAELIVEGFEPWLPPGRLQRAVDVGTGSGCLAIALAHYHPQVRVDALDISDAALELARRNVRAHGLSDRVECLHSDLLSAVTDRSYDLILANPPYVPTTSMHDLPTEFTREPALGLEAGADGLDLVRRLLVQAPMVLSDHGVLICEVGEAAEALDDLLGEHLELIWLDFAHGGEGVFLLDAWGCSTAARIVGAAK